MVKKWEITIPQFTGNESRRAYIYLPESYEWDPERRYPVLYMFDGHNVFFDWDATYGKCWGMKEYMDQSKTQMIVTAVECNRGVDNGRLSEYSPFDFSDVNYGKFKGRGRETMEWFVCEFKPYIDQNYRTIPDREHTYIAGSSMGGLMSLYAVSAFNDVFSKAVALSPSIWTAPGKIAKMIRETNYGPETTVYLDYGSEELGYREKASDQFAKVTGLMIKKGVFVSSRIIPGGTHSEASWERQIPFFMEALNYQR